jgi:predicted Holliday junction resolvase-like endonuclease
MEWELFRLVWSSIVTIAIAVIAGLWKIIMDKVSDLQQKVEETQRELNRVQVTYVQKEEIHRIESRIDQRFSEMKEFFSQLIHRASKD